MTSIKNTNVGRRPALLLAFVVSILALSGGIAVAATITCQVGADCLGTKNADTLTGTASIDHIYGRGGGDTLKGLGETDSLLGQGGKDKLLGGAAYDYMVGGAGDDALSGGGGPDQYYFADGWGKDSITDAATPKTTLNFRDWQTGTQDTDDVIVDLRSGAGPEARDASGTNTINWDGSVIDGVSGGDGDDQITGNASGNAITGRGGADSVFGGDGDDQINVADGSSTDTVYCGPGDDSVSYDEDPVGIVTDEVASDCEHLYPE